MLSQVRLGISTISRRLTTSSTCHQVPLDRFTEEEEPMRLAAAQMGTMMDIGGRNIFNSDHDMFRSQVRRWMRERLAPLQASFEESSWASAAESFAGSAMEIGCQPGDER